jgi:general stress protein CsbA
LKEANVYLGTGKKYKWIIFLNVLVLLVGYLMMKQER